MTVTAERDSAIVFDLATTSVSRNVSDRARELAAGRVRLTSINGMDPSQRQVMLAAGVRLPDTWFARGVIAGRSGIYHAEILVLDGGQVRAYCTCMARRLCSHLVALYAVAIDANGGA